jgi:CBS domain-containing protein
MLVRERMSRKPVTVTADTPIAEALKGTRQKHVRRLPVLDREGGSEHIREA